MAENVIRSRQNIHVKALRKVFAQSGTPGSKVAMLEGEHLAQEALAQGLTVVDAYVREDALNRFRATLAQVANPAAIHVLSADVFDSAVVTESPQGIALSIMKPEHDLEVILRRPEPLVLVLDGIQDPGNVGTIVRSAEAFGATCILALPGTASCWNLKAVRASAGAVLRMPVFAMDDLAAEENFFRHGLRIVAAVAGGGSAPAAASWSGPVALLIGSEGRGLSPAWQKRADSLLTIPLSDSVESLNAATAAALLLYEAAKNRDPLKHRKAEKHREAQS